MTCCVKLESPAMDERALMLALRPWTRRLMAEAALRWLVRGGIAGLVVASLVLAVGWLTPFSIQQLQPIAFELALPMLLSGLVIGLWPTSRLARAAELDRRLGLKDRLATAWLTRSENAPMAQLQRGDALRQLAHASELRLRVERTEAIA